MLKRGIPTARDAHSALPAKGRDDDARLLDIWQMLVGGEAFRRLDKGFFVYSVGGRDAFSQKRDKLEVITAKSGYPLLLRDDCVFF